MAKAAAAGQDYVRTQHEPLCPYCRVTHMG